MDVAEGDHHWKMQLTIKRGVDFNDLKKHEWVLTIAYTAYSATERAPTCV